MTTKAIGPLTYADQKGKPGHCFAAQVFGPNGDSLAIIEATEDAAIASAYAQAFAATPDLMEALESIRSMPCTDANDSESLRHTIKTLRYIASRALIKTGAP